MPDARPSTSASSAPKPPTKRSTRSLGAGLTLVVSVVAFAFGGLWLDGQFGTRPLCLVVGIALGFIGGMIHFVGAVAPNALPWNARKNPGDGIHANPSDPNQSDEAPLGTAPSGKNWKRWEDSDFDDERAARDAAEKNDPSGSS